MPPQTLRELLEVLDLAEHLPAFEENEVGLGDLPELTEEDLRELGLVKLGPRKKLLKAIRELGEGAGNAPVAGPAAEDWPYFLALPLREYGEETHPVARLWAACDTVEMLLRLLVIAGVAEQSESGGFSDSQKRELQQLIESPTLGAWFVMAQKLHGDGETADFVRGPLTALLYGPEKPGSPESSFLRLRNRLAHGGGLLKSEAARLLSLWESRFAETLEAAAFLKGWELLAREAEGSWMRLRGCEVHACEELPGGVAAESGVWLRREDTLLRLWPLALFGVPDNEGRSGQRALPQIYSRRDVVRLTYTPIGGSGLGEAISSAGELRHFEQLFALPDTRETAFHVASFEKDLRRDARSMVGREAEMGQVKEALASREAGVWWLSGAAGMGKSTLMAALACRLMEEAAADETVLAYRFRAGDQTRCNRDALAQFLVERLQAAGVLREDFEDKSDTKAEKRLEQLFNALRLDRKVLLLLDGLDEVARGDASFAKDIPLALRVPRLRCLCAGRPESGLPEQMRMGAAISLFPEGLPPMRREEIRGMLLDKIGPLRKKLLRQDQEQGGDVVNPFIEGVCERAQGLPIYVKYVIGDVLAGRYRVLDGEETLPESLHAYHEELLRRLGIGDLQMILTPLAAILACALEPLTTEQLEAILVLRKIVQEAKTTELIEKGLTSISSMLRNAPTPEGKNGYVLFHESLRLHILASDKMKQSVATTKEAFALLAKNPHEGAKLHKYFLRCGIEHLIEANHKQYAIDQLVNIELFSKMIVLSGWERLNRCWEKLGGEKMAGKYLQELSKLYDNEVKCFDKLFYDIIRFFHLAQWNETGVSAFQIFLNKIENIKIRNPEIFFELSYIYCDMLWMNDDVKKAVEYLESIINVHISDTASSIWIARSKSLLGNIYRWNFKKFQQAALLQEEGLRTLSCLKITDSIQMAETLNDLGYTYQLMGKYADARTKHLQALQLIRTVKGGICTEIFMTFAHVSYLSYLEGDFLSSLEYINNAYEGSKTLIGAGHPDTLTFKAHRSRILYKTNSKTLAEKEISDAVREFELLYGCSSRDTEWAKSIQNEISNNE